MSKHIRLILYILVMLAGVAYPVSKIIRFEFPADEGKVYLFQTGAVDPYDPFRGRYVTLAPLPDRIEGRFDRGDVFALLKAGPDGVAEVTGLVGERPATGDFIPVRAWWWSGNETRFALPFTRFYLNEKLAPEAERAVREWTRRGNGRCQIKVRVYPGGIYRVEDLLIDGRPIHEILRGKQLIYKP